MDLSVAVPLADRPASYTAGSYYEDFDYIFPEEFIKAGNPQLKSYTAWYDQNNIKGMQFTFGNGKTRLTTPMFGTSNGYQQQTEIITTPVTSV